jgi:hypothetical protein
MRPLDRNEASYVGAAWRVLVIVNRVQMIGALLICLVSLGGAGIMGVLFLRGPRGHAVLLVLMTLFCLAMALAFGFVFVVRLKVDDEPVPSMAYEIEGPFREKTSARSATRHGIGNTYLSVPPQWLPLLRRAGSSRVLTAEIADGPAETSILLTVNGVLSVSDEVAHGYLSATGASSAPTFAAVAFSFFVVAALFAGASYDGDLTLSRYLKVGSDVARFASIAELERAQPPAFGRVALAGVTLERRGYYTAVARDDASAELSEEARLSSELERNGRELEQAPCTDAQAACSADLLEHHAEATTLEVAKVLEGAEAWMQGLTQARQGGLAIRDRGGRAPDLEPIRWYFKDARHTLGTEADRSKRAQDRIDTRVAELTGRLPAAARNFNGGTFIRESARKQVAQEAETELKNLVVVAQGELRDAAEMVGKRHDLEGILYRQPSGEQWLAVGASYDEFGLWAQVVACVTGLLSALLIALSARQVTRGRKLYRERVAALPRSL